MFRYRAPSSASTLVLCSTLSAIPSMACAQTAGQPLPPVTIEAPTERQSLQPARKPPPGTAMTSRRKKPVATAAAGPPVAPNDSGTNASPGTPPIKQRFQLPQESFSITAKQIDETINLKDPEDAVKYLPSLFVRKRNDGDNQAVLATRTWGLSSSARTLIYYDDLLDLGADRQQQFRRFAALESDFVRTRSRGSIFSTARSPLPIPATRSAACC